MSEDLYEQIKLFLPKYLTPAESRHLFEELKRFPSNKDFYLLSDPPAELLQGDGWRGFVAIDFDTVEKRTVSGLILSNSCDIQPNNPRALPVRILFCPLIKLTSYSERLSRSGKSLEQVEALLSAIREQKVTSIFYLPERPDTGEESIVVLDDIHAHPLQHFIKADRSRLFTLNQYAFYLLVMKLSIHFSRFQEDVKRVMIKR